MSQSSTEMPDDPALHRASVGGEAVVSSSVQTGLLTVVGWKVQVNHSDVFLKLSFVYSDSCSPLYRPHMLLVRLSGDRALERKPVHICLKKKQKAEADTS